MRTNKTALLVALILAAARAVGATNVDSYICISEHEAGISYNKASQEWESKIFRPSEKMILSRANPSERKQGLVWTVKDVGSTLINYTCKQDINEWGYIRCSGLGEFNFNSNNGRYLSTYMIGYVSDRLGSNSVGDEGSNTPTLKAGKCSPISIR